MPYWLNIFPYFLMRKKVLIFFFLIAEDTIDAAIDITNLQSEADSDQLSHISNGRVSAPVHRGTAEKFRGYPCAPPACPCTCCGCLQQVLLGWQGRPPCWSGEVGEGSTDLPPPPCPATHCHLNTGKDHCCFCLDDFASSCSSDRHSELHTPGSCSRGGHQKGCCALCNETCSSGHSTLQLAWLQLGLSGCCTLLWCLSLLTGNTDTMGFSVLLHGDWVTPGQTSCCLSMFPLLSCWIHGPEGLNLSVQLQLSWPYMGTRVTASAAEVCQASDALLTSQTRSLGYQGTIPGQAGQTLVCIWLFWFLSKKSKQLLSWKNADLLRGAL